MKLLLVAALGLLTVGPVYADDAIVLFEKYKCYQCHADREAKTGPAYVDVATAFRGKQKAVATITSMIKKGVHGAGPWHMPPHPEISDADARKMASYILSLKN